jgi:membrane-associated phospholipid phosphatase
MGGALRWMRRHPDGGLGLRLALAGLAAFLVAGPFAVLLALVDARWAPLRRLDDSATRDTNAFMWRHPGWLPALRATAYVLHPWVFRTVIIAMAVWLAVRGARRLAVWALVTIAVAGLLEIAVKVFVGRARPVLSIPIAHAPGASFPSGHALTAAVGCPVIVIILLPVLHGLWRAVAWAAAGVLSVAAAAFRVLLGVHYVSDVVAGWVLGVAIVAATVAAFATWRHAEGRTAAH